MRKKEDNNRPLSGSERNMSILIVRDALYYSNVHYHRTYRNFSHSNVQRRRNSFHVSENENSILVVYILILNHRRKYKQAESMIEYIRPIIRSIGT